MLFTLKNVCGTANVPSFDNNGAFVELCRMMGNHEVLDLRFGTDQQEQPYVWVESRQTAGFKLLLNQDILDALINYLYNGSTDCVITDPNDIEKVERDGKSFRVQMFEQFIINDAKHMQQVSEFRDKPGYISAYFRYSRGKIFFRVERTPELEELIAEHTPKRK